MKDIHKFLDKCDLPEFARNIRAEDMDAAIQSLDDWVNNECELISQSWADQGFL